MKSLLIALAVMFALIGGASAQISEDKAKKSTETIEKMRQLDLLNQLLPLVMTKEQIRKLLPSIEKSRADVKTEEGTEADLIAKYAARVDQAVKDGIQKGDVPDKKFLVELNALIRTMSMRRDAIAHDNVDRVLEAMKATLNAGQLKAAANSLNPTVFLTGIKVEEMTEDQKIRLFIQEIMLDPLAYDILVKMQASPIG